MPRLILMLAILAVCGGTKVEADSAELLPCGADQLQALVGQPARDVQASFPENVRIIPPNSAVTQDFRPDRLNVDLDGAGLIVRIWCG